MAYISFQPSDYFNTTLYTGTGTAIGSGGTAHNRRWIST